MSAFTATPPPPQSSPLESVELTSFLSTAQITAITECFGHGPTGNFLKTDLGVTHYKISEPKKEKAGGTKKYVVMCHGIGTNINVYSDLAKTLSSDGYTVIRYEFFDHGWSTLSDKATLITEDVMVKQVDDMLTHITGSPTAEVHNFVGHSTGGLVSIACANKLPHRNINKLFLVSPAMWANKPFVGVVADKFPNLMNKLNNNDMTRGAIGAAIKDGYLKNCHVAFAFDKVNKKYVYPEAYNNAYKFTEKLLNVHPFAVHGIGNVNTNILRLDLLPAFRDTLKLLSTRRENPVSTRLVFGTLDLCVDYTSP